MDTTTSYLGFRLPHPFIAGASPFGHRLDSIKRLEDAGCAAVVLHSLFEEQIALAMEGRIGHMDPSDPQFRETLARYPAAGDYPLSPDQYVEHIARVKRAVAIPVIASINGGSAQSWLAFAREIEQAGADALELNLYAVVTDLHASSAAVENEWIRMVRELRALVDLPIAVKLTPFFTAFGSVASRLTEAGADALVLFNRFYEADIDITTAQPALRLELSTTNELRLRLHWIALLHGHVRAALALTGGVDSPNDGIKAILAGADVVQLVSALLRHGPTHLTAMRAGLERWLEWKHFSRLDEARGLASFRQTVDPSSFERASYLQTLQIW